MLALPLIVIAVLVAHRARQLERATLIIVIGLVFTPIVARTVRAAVLGERDLDYVQAARLRGERAPYIMFKEILPNVMAPDRRRGDRAARLRDLRGRRPRRSSASACSRRRPTGSLQITENYTLLNSGTYWWTMLFPALAIATLVIGVNLVADGLQQVVDR